MTTDLVLESSLAALQIRCASPPTVLLHAARSRRCSARRGEERRARGRTLAGSYCTGAPSGDAPSMTCSCAHACAHRSAAGSEPDGEAAGPASPAEASTSFSMGSFVRARRVRTVCVPRQHLVRPAHGPQARAASVRYVVASGSSTHMLLLSPTRSSPRGATTGNTGFNGSTGHGAAAGAALLTSEGQQPKRLKLTIALPPDEALAADESDEVSAASSGGRHASPAGPSGRGSAWTSAGRSQGAPSPHHHLILQHQQHPNLKEDKELLVLPSGRRKPAAAPTTAATSAGGSAGAARGAGPALRNSKRQPPCPWEAGPECPSAACDQ